MKCACEVMPQLQYVAELDSDSDSVDDGKMLAKLQFTNPLEL